MLHLPWNLPHMRLQHDQAGNILPIAGPLAGTFHHRVALDSVPQAGSPQEGLAPLGAYTS